MRTTFAGTEEDQAYLVLQMVSAWVRTIGQKNWNNTTLLPPDDVVGVVLSASRREMNNPDRVGPVSVTRQPVPERFFTPGEMAILKKKSSGAMYTMSFRREDEQWAMGYIFMTTGLWDEPMPYLSEWDPGYGGTVRP